MRIFPVLAIYCVILATSDGASWESNARSFAYVLPTAGRWVYVTVSDSPLGPMGMVSSADPRKNEDASDLKHTQKLFTMSRAQFDQVWNAITSGSLQKYAIGPRPRGKLDLPNSYVFFVSEPGRGGTFYVIPKNKAPSVVAGAATHLLVYAK